MKKLSFEDLLNNEQSIVQGDLMSKITGGTKESCHCVTTTEIMYDETGHCATIVEETICN